MKKLLLGVLCSSLLIMFGCSDDDEFQQTGSFTVTIENVSDGFAYTASGIFDTPFGAVNPGAIGPGGKYQFDVKAAQGEYLSFVTMFVESNDLFYAPAGKGIALYDDNGDPIQGNVTSQVRLWDAGTEVNEEPGVGPNQVMRQSAAGVGVAENGTVVPIDQVNDGFTYPAVSDVISVTIQPTNDYMFTVTIENVSDANTLNTSMGPKSVPLSPGGWVVHSADEPLFTSGDQARGNGIEEIAEDGDPSAFNTFIGNNTGIVYPLSPGVYVVHENGEPIFDDNEADFGEGLEEIAEDGDPSLLNASLASHSEVVSRGIFNTPEGASAPSAIGPGGKYVFSFTASEGDHLSIATMFVQSNDLFIGFDDDGLKLYDGNVPVSGDLTSMLKLYDAGTELNEEPGYGPNQVIRQSGPDTGLDEDDVVREVDDVFTYPALSSVIKLTISVN